MLYFLVPAAPYEDIALEVITNDDESIPIR